MRTRHGWIYREPASGVTPARIRVELIKGDGKHGKVFDDNHIGAQQAVDFISRELGNDTWKIEDLAFLGCRIFTETPVLLTA